MGNKQKILFICDKKGWLQYYKATQLKKYLQKSFDVGIFIIEDDNINKFKDFDVFITFDADNTDIIDFVKNKKKIIGVSKGDNFSEFQNAYTTDFNLYKNNKNSIFYIPEGVNPEIFKYTDIPIERKMVIGSIGFGSHGCEYIKYIANKVGCRYITNTINPKNFYSHDDLSNFYKDIDVLVVNSLINANAIPILEAASCGRFSITNNFNFTDDFINNGNNGFIVTDEIKSYVDILNEFKNNRTDIIRIGKNAYETVKEEWTWKYQAERLKLIIQKKVFNKKKKIKRKRKRSTLKDRPTVIKPKNKKKPPVSSLNRTKKKKKYPDNIINSKKPGYKNKRRTVVQKYKTKKKQKPNVISSKNKYKSPNIVNLNNKYIRKEIEKNPDQIKISIKKLKGNIRRLAEINNSLINKRNELRLRNSLLREDIKCYKE